VKALQNALVVKDAEAYYRAMFKGGDVSAWNIRDRHMFDVIVGECFACRPVSQKKAPRL
jgi:erythromycin esterase-like protein